LLLLASRVRHWKDALLIVQPDTLLRWPRAGFRLFWRWKSRTKTQPAPLAAETIALIRQMARENLTWGAECIHGELLKLGIPVAKRTIQKYLRGVRPVRSPSQAWRTFLKNLAHEMWACDGLPVVDLWFRPVFIFFLIELGSRRVVHLGVTRHPTSEWVTQQLREATPNATGPKYLIRDNDGKYGALFDRVAEASGIEILKIPCRARSANAICERFVGSVRRESLDHLLIFSDWQLYRVMKEYVGYFNRARPPQGIEQKILEEATIEAPPREKGKIIAFRVLNGLHHVAIRSLETDRVSVWQ
jgi:putative transposase